MNHLNGTYIGPRNEGLTKGQRVEVVTSAYKVKNFKGRWEHYVDVCHEGFRYFVKPRFVKSEYVI